MEGSDDAAKYTLFFDYDNLCSICDKCHGELHAKNQSEK
jgi:hypothetical protein